MVSKQKFIVDKDKAMKFAYDWIREHTEIDIKTKKRTRDVAELRFMFCYYCNEYKISQREIGDFLKIDRTSVLYGYQEYPNKLLFNPKLSMIDRDFKHVLKAFIEDGSTTTVSELQNKKLRSEVISLKKEINDLHLKYQRMNDILGNPKLHTITEVIREHHEEGDENYIAQVLLQAYKDINE